MGGLHPHPPSPRTRGPRLFSSDGAFERIERRADSNAHPPAENAKHQKPPDHANPRCCILRSTWMR